MKNTDRFIALALCFTLTLGAFAYRPPTAKAIAVVDDAIVIGALLTAFSAGCGLIFSNNGMTSSEIASAMTTKWNEYKETLSDTVSSFSAWLGYDDMDALITDLRWDSVKECLAIPRAVAQKFTEFTTWLMGTLASGSVIASGSRFVDDLVQRAIEIGWLSGVDTYSDYVAFYLPVHPASSSYYPPYHLVCLLVLLLFILLKQGASMAFMWTLLNMARAIMLWGLLINGMAMKLICQHLMVALST